MTASILLAVALAAGPTLLVAWSQWRRERRAVQPLQEIRGVPLLLALRRST